jgi:triosephosphate isomerase
MSGITSLEMANRRPFIAGNWKMNPETLEEAIKLAKDIGDAGVKSHFFAPVAFPPPINERPHIYSVLILLHI